MNQSERILSGNKGYISKVTANEGLLSNKINLFPFSDKYFNNSFKKEEIKSMLLNMTLLVQEKYPYYILLDIRCRFAI